VDASKRVYLEGSEAERAASTLKCPTKARQAHGWKPIDKVVREDTLAMFVEQHTGPLIRWTCNQESVNDEHVEIA
jgi:hypothetical protein